MATFTCYEDIEAWKLAREICLEIHELTRQGELKTDFALRNQMDRSSGSIMDNIAEGFERNGTREFIQHLSIAKGSCGELRSQLIRASDFKYVSKLRFDQLNAALIKLSARIGSLMVYLSTSSYRGSKFRPKSLSEKVTP